MQPIDRNIPYNTLLITGNLKEGCISAYTENIIESLSLWVERLKDVL